MLLVAAVIGGGIRGKTEDEQDLWKRGLRIETWRAVGSVLHETRGAFVAASLTWEIGVSSSWKLDARPGDSTDRGEIVNLFGGPPLMKKNTQSPENGVAKSDLEWWFQWWTYERPIEPVYRI